MRVTPSSKASRTTDHSSTKVTERNCHDRSETGFDNYSYLDNSLTESNTRFSRLSLLTYKLFPFSSAFLWETLAPRIFHNRRHVAADSRRNLDRLISLRKYASLDDGGESQRRNANGEGEPESWTGRWMPDRPNDPTPPPKVFPKMDQTTDFESFHSFHGRVPMGYSSKSCDDAKVDSLFSLSIPSPIPGSRFSLYIVFLPFFLS